jgi:hypothetical protein
VLGGLLVNVHSARSFEILYLIDSLTFVAYIRVLVPLRKVGSRVISADVVTASAPPRYREVFKDPVFVRVLLLMCLLSSIGWGPAPCELSGIRHGTGWSGDGSRRLCLRRQHSGDSSQSAIRPEEADGLETYNSPAVYVWPLCLSYGLILVSAGLNGWVAGAGFVISLGIFGLGETIMAPTIPAIVNDIAPDELRGRYNGVHALAWSFGSVAGPAMAGLFLGAGAGVALFTINLVGHGAAAFYVTNLKRHLPQGTNIIGEFHLQERDVASTEI